MDWRGFVADHNADPARIASAIDLEVQGSVGEYHAPTDAELIAARAVTQRLPEPMIAALETKRVGQCLGNDPRTIRWLARHG